MWHINIININTNYNLLGRLQRALVLRWLLLAIGFGFFGRLHSELQLHTVDLHLLDAVRVVLQTVQRHGLVAWRVEMEMWGWIDYLTTINEKGFLLRLLRLY